MKTLTVTLALLLSTPAAFAADSTKKADTAEAVMMVATPDFAKTVMSSDQFEIRSSEMAEKNAEASDVKSFAADMIKDHTKTGAELMAALGKTAMPAEPEMAPKQAAMLKQLEAADGADFQRRSTSTCRRRRTWMPSRCSATMPVPATTRLS